MITKDRYENGWQSQTLDNGKLSWAKLLVSQETVSYIIWYVHLAGKRNTNLIFAYLLTLSSWLKGNLSLIANLNWIHKLEFQTC